MRIQVSDFWVDHSKEPKIEVLRSGKDRVLASEPSLTELFAAVKLDEETALKELKAAKASASDVRVVSEVNGFS